MHRLLLVAALAGCSLDLELPPAPSQAARPTLTAVAPATAHAGVRLALQGTAFDPNPAGNQVFFAGGLARGEGFAPDGALYVRVPDDAGSGPLVVQTAAGRSDALEGFTYLGLGRPRYGRVVAEHALSLDPLSVAVSDSHVAVLSNVLDAALVTGGAARASDLALGVTDLAANERGAFFVVLEKSFKLQRVEVATTAGSNVRAEVTLPARPTYLLPAATRVVAVFVDVDESTTTVRHYDATTLAPLGSWLLEDIATFETAQVLPDGTVIGIATDWAFSSGIGRVAPDGTETFVTQDELLFSTESALIDDHAMLVFEAGSHPMLVDPTTGDLSDPLEDYTGGFPNASVSVRGQRPLAVAARCASSEVAAWDADGKLVWTYRGLPCPRRLTVDAAGTRVYVADARLNEVRVLEAATGTPLGVATFPLDPGYLPGTGLARAGTTLYLPAHDDRLLQLDLTQGGLRASPASLEATQVASDGTSAWVFGRTSRKGTYLGVSGEPVTFDLAEQVMSARRQADGTLLVATPKAVHRLEGGVVTATRTWGSGFDRSVEALEPTPSGGALVLGATNGGDEVELWSADALFTEGATPDVLLPRVSLGFTIPGAFPREGRYFVPVEEADVATVRVFDGDRALVATNRSAMRGATFSTTGPGGQSVVWLEPGGRLHLGTFNADDEIIEKSWLTLGGALRGVEWNAAGDRLYALVAGRDVVLELE